ncbi:hypothetical protein J6590_061412 [Homalodisca vitripennis]|nr:hypothetical protein J6590_061412 [Homalodisca vitripennis]
MFYSVILSRSASHTEKAQVQTKPFTKKLARGEWYGSPPPVNSLSLLCVTRLSTARSKINVPLAVQVIPSNERTYFVLDCTM